jgi:hypothetical protein
MGDIKLVLIAPQGSVIATSLGVDGLAKHNSPGSGKYFCERSVLFELALADGAPAFSYLDEGGWRDLRADTAAALAAVAGGKRTKTALSNNAFSCTPIAAHRACYLVKTGGLVQPMLLATETVRFASHACHEHMSPDEIAATIGQPAPARRGPRLYLVLCPIELLVMSNLTPAEIAWYATHRPGKIFRQTLFTELEEELPHLAAPSRYAEARHELTAEPRKKTKTIVGEDCISRVPYSAWVAYKRLGECGLFAADREHMRRWVFPAELEERWEKAEG